MNSPSDDSQRELVTALVGDGRPLLQLVALALLAAGGFAIFQSATGHFLPHDVQFLGMGREQLCAINECRIVHFMFHDRVSFGGALMAIGWLYLWLAEFPLRTGEAWAWWLFLTTGATGFGSFLAYLGYGYLDTWHGLATLFLLVPYLWGLMETRRLLHNDPGWRSLLKPGHHPPRRSADGVGRALLLATGVGMILGGGTILAVGMTTVFVPQDLEYMGLTAPELHRINSRLVPLIAHDRAGFGGGVGTCGLLMFFSVWCGRPARSLWQAVALAGVVGFLCAIGIHPAIGYTDFIHLLPAYLGALMFLGGLGLSYRSMCRV